MTLRCGCAETETQRHTLRGDRHEEAGENKSIKGRSEEKEREKLLEKVERGEEISHLTRKHSAERIAF